MSVYDQDSEVEHHERLASYIHGGGGDWGNAEDRGSTAPGSPDPLFDSPGPSNIASAFAAAASSNRIRTRSQTIRAGRSGELRETEAQAEANADNDGWTDTDSVSTRAASVRTGPDATFAAGAGGTGGRGKPRRLGYGGGDRPARRSPPVDFGMAGENPAPAVSNVAVPYSCWSCGAMVSIRRKEVFVMCAACGGRIVMKVRPEQ